MDPSFNRWLETKFRYYIVLQILIFYGMQILMLYGSGVLYQQGILYYSTYIAYVIVVYAVYVVLNHLVMRTKLPKKYLLIFEALTLVTFCSCYNLWSFLIERLE